MKILKVLIKESAAEAYRSLDNLQATTLCNVADGKVDYRTAKAHTMAVLDDLMTFGLLDGAYMLTNDGEMVANMVRKHGPRDARMVARRNAAAGIAPVVGDGKYSKVGDVGDLEVDGAVGISGRGLGIGGRPNRDNSI